MPERAGNRRADSLRNIIETGRIGLLFLVPGLGETLRVNGRACVTRDDEVLASLTAQEKQPTIGIGVEVEECFLQCAKALIRSQLWHGIPRKSSLPSFAKILMDQTQIAGHTVESLQEAIEESYAQRLY
ncbi:MAG: pyridoxamine 5'-phosphate oxidase family protein [Pirellulaceae bacterium]